MLLSSQRAPVRRRDVNGVCTAEVNVGMCCRGEQGTLGDSKADLTGYGKIVFCEACITDDQDRIGRSSAPAARQEKANGAWRIGQIFNRDVDE